MGQSRALVIPFFRYQPHFGTRYTIYFDWLVEALKVWGNEFDRLYLLDQDMNFTIEQMERLKAVKSDYEIIRSSAAGHHWVQFKRALPQVKEDLIMCLDCDVLIWKAGVIDGWFKQAESSELVTNFDGSGGLAEQVRDKFPILKHYESNRMGSYYFVIHRDFLEKIPDWDFAPITYPLGTHIPELNYTTKEGDWSDSFGLFTIKALALNPKVGYIEDDRSSIYLEEDLVVNKVPNSPQQLGYYHIRNGNLPIYTLDSKECDPFHYNHVNTITPFREHLRLFAWYTILCSKLNKNADILKIVEFLEDRKVDPKNFGQYLTEFISYHDFPVGPIKIV